MVISGTVMLAGKLSLFFTRFPWFAAADPRLFLFPAEMAGCATRELAARKGKMSAKVLKRCSDGTDKTLQTSAK